ncbi:hypothetical protein G7Y89_g15505 [Cudoniella acicularis]|uniref:C2H2-type domain-containing protein n=1 Tax=Cudoniella acicularis TaxID=354080 RepID=A0A8H4VMC6_9HELO|nr:hypothetical protein G7Y89_g15505 [Cudoniella acicularis]
MLTELEVKDLLSTPFPPPFHQVIRENIGAVPIYQMKPQTPATGALQIQNVQPADLLQYLPSYKVLICSSCHYAIQPNAIPRHLKEIHSIHRSNRKPFMQHVTNFQLEEAGKIVDLDPGEFPVPLLPVFNGLRCEYEGCKHLCVSTKRMKTHWSSEHGRPGQAVFDWHPVPLQTFFKGNLLRYFTSPRYNEPRKLGPIHSACQSRPESGMRNIPVYNLTPLPFKKDQYQTRLTEQDQSLLEHYIDHTSTSIGRDEETHALWQVVVPQLAHQHAFLMHAVLACSALHLAHKCPEQQRQQTILASDHHDRGMPLFRSAIDNVTEENCHAVLVFSHLLVIYSFALEKQDDRLFLTERIGPDVLPSWLHFLRNGCSMLCTVWDPLEKGLVRHLTFMWELPINIPQDCTTPLLDHFLSVIPPADSEDFWSEDVIQTYRSAAVELDRAFACTRALGTSFTTWDLLRIWPLRISVEYMDLLARRQAGALVLLAHYCVILKNLEFNWYFEGRATRLLSNIVLCLDQKWHGYIAWPLEEVGVSAEVMARD